MAATSLVPRPETRRRVCLMRQGAGLVDGGGEDCRAGWMFLSLGIGGVTVTMSC